MYVLLLFFSLFFSSREDEAYSFESFTAAAFDIDPDSLSPEERKTLVLYVRAVQKSASPENVTSGLSREICNHCMLAIFVVVALLLLLLMSHQYEAFIQKHSSIITLYLPLTHSRVFVCIFCFVCLFVCSHLLHYLSLIHI